MQAKIEQRRYFLEVFPATIIGSTIISVDLSKCSSVWPVEQLPSSVSSVTFNNCDKIKLFRALRPHVHVVEFKGFSPADVLREIRCARAIKISKDTDERTVENLASLPKSVNTVYLYSTPEKRLSTETIGKLPRNITKIWVSPEITAEELSALGSHIQSIQFNDSDQPLSERAALIRSIPLHIDVFGIELGENNTNSLVLIRPRAGVTYCENHYPFLTQTVIATQGIKRARSYDFDDEEAAAADMLLSLRKKC